MDPVSAGGVHVGSVRFGYVRVGLRVVPRRVPRALRRPCPSPSASWYVMALRRRMAIIGI